jgi:pantetheine-phosphate adenylyltransferase
VTKERNITAVFPGSFDPVTNGHLDVIERCTKIFSRVIVAIGNSSEKKYLFSARERVEMVQDIVSQYPNVTVESYTGLTVEYVRIKAAQVMVRALRNLTDVQYEFQLALTNRSVSGIETVFIMTGEKYAFTSSSLIREIARFKGDVSGLVPPSVAERLKAVFPGKPG